MIEKKQPRKRKGEGKTSLKRGRRARDVGLANAISTNQLSCGENSHKPREGGFFRRSYLENL